MASAAALKDVEDKFFECCICLDILKEPKLLPCLHRICKECLKGLINKHRRKGEFNCPLCKEPCIIPPEGVDGFRTDFHMKSILEYMQLQQTAKTEDLMKECAGCSKEANMTSYCFKCKGFLCEQCSTDHLTKNMMKEHKTSVLSLKEIREQKLTLERLASLTETPRCHGHVEKPAEVCCGTCRNLPICMVCAQVGEHKGHELHDVRVLAREERLRVEKILEKLEQFKDNVDRLPAMVEEVETQLSEDICAKKEKLKAQHTKLAERIGQQQTDNEELLRKNEAVIDDLEKQEVAELEEERVKEVEKAVMEINNKYAKLTGGKKTKNQDLRKGQRDLYGQRGANITQRLVLINKEYKDLDKSIDMQGGQNQGKLGRISKEATNRKTRFDNFRSTVSSILASKDNWSESQCLPDISNASDSLIEEVKKEYPELRSMGQVDGYDLSGNAGCKVSITEEPVSVINIEGVESKEWRIHGLVPIGSGSMVVTGAVDEEHTHITVIDKQGKIMSSHQTQHRKRDDGRAILCKCSPLDLFHLSVSHKDGEIGIYNTQNISYMMKHMSDIVSGWGKRELCGIAADQINKKVYIGTDGADVFVLDDKLNYCHTLKLPQGVRCSVDIAIHNDNLIVCDYAGEKAYIFTRRGPDAKLVCELPKPDHNGWDWGPYRVCTDSNGFVYINWSTNISEQLREIITQYSQDGLHLLITKEVQSVVESIGTVITDGSEQLVLATSNGKLYTYGLEMES